MAAEIQLNCYCSFVEKGGTKYTETGSKLEKKLQRWRPKWKFQLRNRRKGGNRKKRGGIVSDEPKMIEKYRKPQEDMEMGEKLEKKSLRLRSKWKF